VSPAVSDRALIDVIAALLLVSIGVGGLVGFIFHSWGTVEVAEGLDRVFIGTDSTTVLVQPWTVTYAWALGIGTGLHVFVMGLILTCLVRLAFPTTQPR
jgi:hypothetical protein